MRVLAILGVIAAALLAFIMVFERDTVSDGEIARREGRVLPNFVRDRVQRLSITNEAGTVVLVRKPDPDDVDEMGNWHVEKPYQSEADQEAVEALMGELEWTNARRRMEDISDKDRARFGLDTPRMKVTFDVGRDRGELVVGNESPKGDGHYVAVDGNDEVFIVGSDLAEALSPPPNHYHTKSLHDGVMLATAKHVTIHGEGRSYDVEKRDGRWWLSNDPAVFASQPSLNAVCDSLDHLLAKRFVTDKPKNLSQYGLDKPDFEVKVLQRKLRKDAAGKAGDSRFEMREFSLRLGASCGDHQGERYATVNDGRVVYCVADAELQPVRDALPKLREERLAPIAPSDVDEVVIEGRKADKPVLRLSKSDDGDQYTMGREGQPGKAAAAEPGSIEAFLVAVAEALPEAPPEGSTDTQGAATSTVRFAGNGKEMLVLELYSAPHGLFVKRHGEGVLRHYGPRAAEQLAVDSAPFRPRKLLEYKSEALKSINLLLGDERQEVSRGDAGSFVLTKPAAGPADTSTLQSLSRLLGGLTAVRFEPAVRQPGMQVGEVRMRFTGPKQVEEHRLTLFASPDAETQLARLDGESSLFVLVPELATLLSKPWLDRRFAAVSLDTVQQLHIVGAKTCTVVHLDKAFRFAESPGTTEQAQALMTAWAQFRAHDVAYGKAANSKVTVELRDDGGERVFEFMPDDDDEAVYVPAFHARLALWPGARSTLLACP